MKRSALLALSSLTVSGILAGCTSPATSNQHPNHRTNPVQSNVTNNTVAQGQSASANETNSTSGSNTSASTGSNGTTANQTSGNTTSTVSPGTNGAQFADYVTQAMAQVKTVTQVPFLFAPTEPAFQPTAQYMGVKEDASSSTYDVTLFSTPASVPMNDPSLNHLPASAVIGAFSGTLYSNHSEAMDKLASTFHVTKGKDLGTVNGFMQQYSTGQTYNSGEPSNYEFPQNLIEWQEGKWMIDILGAPSIDFLNVAKQVDTFLGSNALLLTDGRVLINPNLSGNPETEIGFVFGDTLYECESPSMMNALQMAVSMREYKTYKVTP